MVMVNSPVPCQCLYHDWENDSCNSSCSSAIIFHFDCVYIRFVHTKKASFYWQFVCVCFLCRHLNKRDLLKNLCMLRVYDDFFFVHIFILVRILIQFSVVFFYFLALSNLVSVYALVARLWKWIWILIPRRTAHISNEQPW